MMVPQGLGGCKSGPAPISAAGHDAAQPRWVTRRRGPGARERGARRVAGAAGHRNRRDDPVGQRPGRHRLRLRQRRPLPGVHAAGRDQVAEPDDGAGARVPHCPEQLGRDPGELRVPEQRREHGERRQAVALRRRRCTAFHQDLGGERAHVGTGHRRALRHQAAQRRRQGSARHRRDRLLHPAPRLEALRRLGRSPQPRHLIARQSRLLRRRQLRPGRPLHVQHRDDLALPRRPCGRPLGRARPARIRRRDRLAVRQRLQPGARRAADHVRRLDDVPRASLAASAPAPRHTASAAARSSFCGWAARAALR